MQGQRNVSSKVKNMCGKKLNHRRHKQLQDKCRRKVKDLVNWDWHLSRDLLNRLCLLLNPDCFLADESWHVALFSFCWILTSCSFYLLLNPDLLAFLLAAESWAVALFTCCWIVMNNKLFWTWNSVNSPEAIFYVLHSQVHISTFALALFFLLMSTLCLLSSRQDYE